MLNKFLPVQHVNTIYEIDIKKLKSKGIKGIITDLDNTLVGAKEPIATPALVNWLRLVQASGFQVLIVSNNNRARVSKFAEPLGIDYIFSAKKPRNQAFKLALGRLKLKPEEAAVIGDQMLTDVFGGNRLGLHTILVKPIAIRDEGFFTRINRRIEKLIIARLKKKGINPWEDQTQ